MTTTTHQPTATTRAVAQFAQFNSTEIAQAGSATAVPVNGNASGWIDCRAYSILCLQGEATGATVTWTAEQRVSEDAQAVALTLDQTSTADGESKILLSDVAVAGFVRVLAAGTADPANTLNLFVLLK